MSRRQERQQTRTATGASLRGHGQGESNVPRPRARAIQGATCLSRPAQGIGLTEDSAQRRWTVPPGRPAGRTCPGHQQPPGGRHPRHWPVALPAKVRPGAGAAPDWTHVAQDPLPRAHVLMERQTGQETRMMLCKQKQDEGKGCGEARL